MGSDRLALELVVLHDCLSAAAGFAAEQPILGHGLQSGEADRVVERLLPCRVDHGDGSSRVVDVLVCGWKRETLWSASSKQKASVHDAVVQPSAIDVHRGVLHEVHGNVDDVHVVHVSNALRVVIGWGLAAGNLFDALHRDVLPVAPDFVNATHVLHAVTADGEVLRIVPRYSTKKE